jgi:hypothetical protein
VSEPGRKLVFGSDGTDVCEKSGKKYRLRNSAVSAIV